MSNKKVRLPIILSIILMALISTANSITVSHLIAKRSLLHDQIAIAHSNVVYLNKLQKGIAYLDDVGAYYLMSDSQSDKTYYMAKYNNTKLKINGVYTILVSNFHSKRDLKELKSIEHNFTDYLHGINKCFLLAINGKRFQSQELEISSNFDSIIMSLDHLIDRKSLESDRLELKFNNTKSIANFVSNFALTTSFILSFLGIYGANKLRNMYTLISEKEANVRYLAYHDSLTGVANRRNITDKINEMIAESSLVNPKSAILLFDLDGFKKVNDTYGHDIGDELLIKVANRVSKLIKESDTIGRLGGDEFIVLVHSIDENIVAKIAKRIIDRLNEPFTISEFQINISASIGISICPDDGNHIEVLMQKADMAMYKAKKGGKNQYVLSHSLPDRQVEHLESLFVKLSK